MVSTRAAKAAYMREWIARDPSRKIAKREYSRRWRETNRERHRAYSRAYHHAHYQPAIRKSVEERFWAKVEKTDGCWLWTGAISGKSGTASAARGYGYFGVTSKKIVRAHRWAYETLVGPIPEGMELDHLCHITTCVNPNHLEAVTHLENVRRR
jgi:hypothetical protein